MRRRRGQPGNWVRTCLALAALALPAQVRADLPSTETFRLFADVRTRLETDWDSRRPDGTMRDDRTRLRARLRIGAEYTPQPHLTFAIRLRSGSDDAQQSPHITLLDFNDNPTGDAHFNFDRWYLRARQGRFWGWVGRNDLPFWKQNELYWDDDVTPAGLAGGFEAATGDRGHLAIHAGLVSLPAGMRDFAGRMALGQIVYDTRLGSGGLTLALGLLSMDGVDAATHPAVALLESGNGSRDYELWVGSVQGRLQVGGRTLTLGADLLHNAADYPDADPLSPGSPEQFTFDNRDRTDGHVLSVLYGGGSDRGAWLAGWYYAHIETLAVNNSYAQDDWVRWGSASQTRSSNLKGHELRFVYHLSQRADLTARLYLVEAIVGPEDGRRFRLDLNYKL